MAELPFLYVGSHFPFCLGRVPYFRTNNSSLEPYGEGTIYPLTLTPAQFAACFWRVKAWRFSGTIAFNVAFGSVTYIGETAFDKTFPRATTEGTLICKENTVPNSPFTTINQTSVSFEGTKIDNTGASTALYELTVRMSIRTGGLSTYRMAALEQNTGLLRCYFGATLFVRAVVGSAGVALAQTEEYEEATASGDLSLILPGQSLTLPMFGDGPELTDVTIEPEEYFEWGETYDLDTGDLL